MTFTIFNRTTKCQCYEKYVKRGSLNVFQFSTIIGMADASNQLIISEDKSKPWITITVAGATAGIIVGAVTFSATNGASKLVSSGSKLTMDTLGEVAGLGATYFVGPITGNIVRLATKAAAKTTGESIEYSGLIAAGFLSAAAGAVTALSITAGTKLVEYSIEYGGKISKEVAIKLADAYLRFKTTHSQSIETSDSGVIIENDWIYVEDLEKSLHVIECNETELEDTEHWSSPSLYPLHMPPHSTSPINL